MRSLVLRRPDGLVEIRRTPASDALPASDAAVRLALFDGFATFAFLLVLALVFRPPFLALGAWALVATGVESLCARALAS